MHDVLFFRECERLPEPRLLLVDGERDVALELPEFGFLGGVEARLVRFEPRTGRNLLEHVIVNRRRADGGFALSERPLLRHELIDETDAHHPAPREHFIVGVTGEHRRIRHFFPSLSSRTLPPL